MKFEYSRDISPPALLLPIRIAPIGADFWVKHSAQIDTGADLSVVPRDLVRDLHLFPHGSRIARGALSSEPLIPPTYHVQLIIAENFRFEAPVLAAPCNYIIIGRDLLNHFVLHADGPSQKFELFMPDKIP